MLDEEDAARAKRHQTSLDEAMSPFHDGPSSDRMMNNPRTPSPNLNQNLSPTLRALYPNRDAYSPTEDEFGQNAGGDDRHGGSGGRRSLGSRMSHKPQPFIHRDAAITRTDLIASAELIYARYFLGGAEKEIYLPPALRIHSFPLSSSQLPTVQHPEYEQQSQVLARVPDMFYSQKEYVYRQMEQDSFPRFLRAKSFGNLTPLSAILRLGEPAAAVPPASALTCPDAHLSFSNLFSLQGWDCLHCGPAWPPLSPSSFSTPNRKSRGSG